MILLPGLLLLLHYHLLFPTTLILGSRFGNVEISRLRKHILVCEDLPDAVLFCVHLSFVTFAREICFCFGVSLPLFACAAVLLLSFVIVEWYAMCFAYV